MKKFFGILLAALLLVAMAAGMALTSSAAEGNVVYISSNGTGDGSSPESPLGNPAGYADKLAAKNTAAYKENAFYTAFDKLKTTGGTVVLVGEVKLDAANAFRTSDAEMHMPGNGANTVTITSTYNGVDYAATKGAKLVIDKTIAPSCGNTIFNGKTVWENLVIDYKHNDKYDSRYDFGGIICCNGWETVFGEGIVCTSESNYYPNIVGGHRYADVKINTNVTIKSGTWGRVYGGTHTLGSVTGNVTITVTGGEIGMLCGSGVEKRGKPATYSKYPCVTGNINITVTGGEIKELRGTNNTGIKGTGEISVSITGGTLGNVFATAPELDDNAGLPTKATLTYAKCPVSVNGTINGFAAGDITVTKDHDLDASNTCKDCHQVICEHTYRQTYVPPTCVSEGKTVNTCIICGNSYNSDIEQPTGVHKYENGFCTVCGAEQPDENVIYIGAKSTGKGDGSSPFDVLGHAENYYEIRNDKDKTVNGTAYKLNALYRAFKKIVATGGTIVVTEEFSIDSADALRSSAAEFNLPSNKNVITITSLHKGVDYAASNGAKIVLDKTKYNVNLKMNGETVWKNITFVSKSDPKAIENKAADKAFIFEANGKKTVFGEGIVCLLGTKDSIYPAISGGSRYAGQEDSGTKLTSDITIKSGIWSEVVGGVYGLKNYGFTTGNLNITIEGGVITTVTGTTSLNYKTGLVTGDVIINVKGGQIGIINGTGKNGIDGNVNITIEPEAKVGVVYGTCDGFKASGDSIAPKNITIDNRGLKGSTDPVKSGTLLTVLMVTAVVSLGGAALAISKKKKAIR